MATPTLYFCIACSSSARSCRCSFSSMFEADEAPNEVLVEDRMLTADSTFTLERNKKETELKKMN